MENKTQIDPVDWEFKKIIPVHNLKPYFEIAERVAKQSECLRRQYGSVIVYGGPTIYYEGATNSRVSKCCMGNTCARSRYSIPHGQRVEVGGEIHSETAVLIKTGIRPASNAHFVLVGFAGDRQLYSNEVWPCYDCARNLKFAGYNHIYIKEDKDNISPLSVSYVLEQHEIGWGNGD